jgi:hypothetical protein
MRKDRPLLLDRLILKRGVGRRGGRDGMEWNGMEQRDGDRK